MKKLRIIGSLMLGLGLIGVFIFAGRQKESEGLLHRGIELIALERSANSDLEFEPAYLELHRTGELRRRGEKLWEMMGNCSLCPRMCGVNRLEGGIGFCRAPGTRLIVSGAQPHFGEERPLVGRGGSGTIFFSHCGLRCVFCQNWEISHKGRGSVIDIERLADLMLALQRRGVHNINFVTPDHYLAHIVLALDIAAARGLRLPLVFNTCGWVPLEILEILDGIVDIYLPDFKFYDPEMAARFLAGARCYPEVTKAAILEMYRQVGIAKPAEDGIIRRGLIIRHLIMPNDVAGSGRFLEWVAENLPKDTYINLMSQFRPAFRAFDYPEISRRLAREEFRKVVHRAKELGLTNLDIQGFW